MSSLKLHPAKQPGGNLRYLCGALAALITSSTLIATEGEREIPAIREVDVLVLGGSSAAVSAAREAANSGASVYLVAPRPFLGEDIASTMRLWLEEDEKPVAGLARQIYGDRNAVLPFKYKTSITAELENPDDTKRLNDGIWNDWQRHSVQYKGEALETIIDLEKSADLKKVTVHAYETPRNTGRALVSASASISQDGENWTVAGETKDKKTGKDPNCFYYEIPLSGKARYIKLTTKVNMAVLRQWLGEIVVESSLPTPPLKNTMTAVTSPIAIKKALDQALLEANIPFLTGVYATELIVDEKNQPCGAVISNRSGRQAVKAKLIIDATPSALIARQAGAKARPFPAGSYTFSRTVMSGEKPKGEGLSVRESQNEYDIKVKAVKMPEYKGAEIKGKLYECKASLPLKDASQSSIAEAEQKMRDLTFTATQLDAADNCFFMRPDSLQCEGKGSSSEPGSIDLGAFRPAGTTYAYVLSQMADIPRDATAKLARPCALMEIGERIGKAAAAEAKKRPALGKAKVVAGSPAGTNSGTEVREILAGLLPNASNDCGKVKSSARELPVLAKCDVLVIGGGTAGAPATISAGRQGMKTIVCEYQANLGGVSTVGVLGSYYFGNVCGFTSEIDEGVKKLGDVLNQSKAEWYRSEARKAGVEIWLGTMATGAIVKGDQLCGAVVVLPDGTRGIVEANAIIDSTGNADIAAAAGEKTEFLDSSELSVQGATMNWRTPGLNVTNVDISFVDDTDAFDMCFFALRARHSFGLNLWDQAPLVNSRERRRLVGVKHIEVRDLMNKRTYSDTIVQCKSPHDTHGQTTDNMLFFSIISGSENIITANLPFRALLPQKLDGLLVTGLGISAHRDALPVLRMQADVQNQGYAAGYAASMSVKDKLPFRKIDIRKLQAHLIEKKILPEAVLKQTDDFSVSDKQLAEAVKQIAPYGGYSGIWTILEAPDRAKPLLAEALKNASEPVATERLSAVLCMLGDSAGAPALIKALENAPDWDKGWNFQGMGAYGRKTSYQDGYVIALGMAKAKEALPVILKKAAALNAKSEYSHFRAISLACEAIGDKSAAPVLASYLDMPGFSGNSLKLDTKFPAYKGGYGNSVGDTERTLCLREISVARALYRLGDHQGKGEAVLRAYLADPRSAYAKHALLVLSEKPKDISIKGKKQ